MTVCPDVRDPTQPCKYSGVCSSVRQGLQGQQGSYGRDCEFFVSISARLAFHPPVSEEAPCEPLPF